jgi:hypothetical protein
VHTGTITSIDFVNPHSYLNFDTVGADGRKLAMRCEMRAATLMRRSGWSEEMVVPGAQVTVAGFAHRDDPACCYLEDVTIGDAAEFNRNDQFETSSVDHANRPLRLASGELAIADVPASGWSARPASLTERGRAEADAFEMWSPEDNPRLRCRPTSVVFDWVFDGAVNRIVQQGDRIVIHYGLYSFERVVHMSLREHRAEIAPSHAGHSIGRWDDDVLVVDTVGFEPGVLVPPLRHSDRLHIVERYRLETEPLAIVRDYVVEDPAYFADAYAGSDKVLAADVPYVAHRCEELAPEFIPPAP